MLIDKLANLVQSNDLTRAEFESFSLKLSSQQSRLFIHLLDVGEASTPELRTALSIGNISDVAKTLNGKLLASGDTRKVICLLKPNTNQFDEVGIIGHWLIVGDAANDGAIQ